MRKREMDNRLKLDPLVGEFVRLLQGRVVIASYNQHIGSFLPSLLVGWAPPKFTRVYGADIVMESTTLKTLAGPEQRKFAEIHVLTQETGEEEPTCGKRPCSSD